MIRRKGRFMMVVAMLFACLSLAYGAAPPPAYTPVQLATIREAQIRVSENRNVLRDGDITRTAADARIGRIMARLNPGLPTSLTEETLMGIDAASVMPRMTTSEREKSFFSGVNFLRLGLIAVFTILTMLLIGKHILVVLLNFPRELWEISAYIGGIGILLAQAAGYTVKDQFSAFFGCLLIGGGLGLTLVIHKRYFKNEHAAKKGAIVRGRFYVQYVCPAVMLAAFSTATLITESSWLGAFAALSLMSLLGFAGEVIPFGYAVGFKDNDALARATSAGLIITALFMGLHAGNVANPLIRAFEPGSLIVGGFVCYLGLLIAGSDRYKSRQKWIVMQAIVLSICFAGVIGGSILGLKSIQIIAGIFLALWTIEKMVEIPGNGFVPWVLKLMAASGTLYLAVTYGAPIYAQYLIY
ncbi:MAG: hypothetical protein A2075_00795 [Geobacteraceae bacterium GWC2_58_44]|nr:MAG: hypothetical protein A2075_00795 [Geobacteraceae bacterium GWC2_58_44]HBG06232.1 hypothetical protein [Geobacter sp.]